MIVETIAWYRRATGLISLGRTISFMSAVSFFFFKQKTAYEMRISDWSSDVCSSDLLVAVDARRPHGLDLHIRAPVTRRRDRAGIGAEADQHRFIAMRHSAELADVELPLPPPGRCRGIANRAVMGPDPRLCGLSAMRQKRPEGRRGGKECVSTGRSRGAEEP